jgi:hypothetical protein
MGRLVNNGPALCVVAARRAFLRPVMELDSGSCAANGANRFVSTFPDRTLSTA